jgi:SAM-dependent methyltransferase
MHDECRAMIKDTNYLKEVREQYENYPYPPVDPSQEVEGMKDKWQITWNDFLSQINHYCFRGRRDFNDNFKVLVAGGGTGDGLIFLAKQLQETSAQIIYLDISERSMEIAQERARLRGLTNISWHHGSILNVPNMDLGDFDYINCCGVLHHLESPLEGLQSLKSVLKTEGAINVMVYGKYGRTGVYQMQELMRTINKGEGDMQQKVNNTRAVLASLPLTNWFKRGESLIPDHNQHGDVGVYDVFLHSQDVAYSVPELYQWAEEECGLHICLSQAPRGYAPYQPERYIRDEQLLDLVQSNPLPVQQAICELLAGDMIHHNFYACLQKNTCANLDDLDSVPFFAVFFEDLNAGILAEQILNNPGLQVSAKEGKTGVKLAFTPGKYTGNLLRYLDGNNSLGEMFDKVRQELGKTKEDLADDVLKSDFQAIYSVFNSVDGMLLRHKSLPGNHKIFVV